MGDIFWNTAAKKYGAVPLHTKAEDFGPQLRPPIWNSQRGVRYFCTLSWFEGNAAGTPQPSSIIDSLPRNMNDI